MSTEENIDMRYFLSKLHELHSFLYVSFELTTLRVRSVNPWNFTVEFLSMDFFFHGKEVHGFVQSNACHTRTMENICAHTLGIGCTTLFEYGSESRFGSCHHRSHHGIGMSTENEESFNSRT